MPKYNVVFLPFGVEEIFEDGKNLLDAAKDLGVGIKSLCGGKRSCGKCKIVIEEGKESLSPITEPEKKLLSSKELNRNYRLACASEIRSGNVRVMVPKESLMEEQIVLKEAKAISFMKNPSVAKFHIELSGPTLEDLTPDFERIKRLLKEKIGLNVKHIDLLVQRNLPEMVRKNLPMRREVNWNLNVTLYDEEEIIDVESDGEDRVYGLALDVGTSTMAVYLLDLLTGDVVTFDSMINPQIRYGEDLMSRVIHCIENEHGLEDLQKSVINAINESIEKICCEVGISKRYIYEMVAVGNSGMHHFFLGIRPDYLGKAPYVPARRGSYLIKAREAGIKINPSGYVYWLPLNAGWVGADNSAVIISVDVLKEEEMTLAIDIGTNGEIFFGNSQKAMVCSAAAGPALEGAQIKFGMRAAEGAIERVKIDEENYECYYKTIKDEPVVGICGSGIVDAAAEMFRTGIVDKSGRFNTSLEEKTDRIQRKIDFGGEYVLAWREETGIDSDIVITQDDIREIQKAKAAIQAGARLLMKKMGVEKIDRIILAGAFGSYIDKISALMIGLLPECPVEKIYMVGNAAGAGAQLALMSKEKREEAEKIPNLVEYVELAGSKEFNKEFFNALHFPHKNPDKYPIVKKIMEKTCIKLRKKEKNKEIQETYQ